MCTVTWKVKKADIHPVVINATLRHIQLLLMHPYETKKVKRKRFPDLFAALFPPNFDCKATPSKKYRPGSEMRLAWFTFLGNILEKVMCLPSSELN